MMDTYRQANSSGDDRYSWFDYRSRGFDDNRGLRIDLLLASWLLAAGIDYGIRAMDKPSDHDIAIGQFPQARLVTALIATGQ